MAIIFFVTLGVSVIIAVLSVLNDSFDTLSEETWYQALVSICAASLLVWIAQWLLH